MFEKIFYYATTAAEAVVAVFGITGPFEQPPYQIRAQVNPTFEIRDYGPATMIEASADGPGGQEAAFRMLFDYITGGNQKDQTIAMTAPVRVTSSVSGYNVRFFLPAKLGANPPPPMDPRVHLVHTKPSTVAVYLFYGSPTLEARAQATETLGTLLASTSWRAAGQPYFLAYNPPFTIPFLKRNEIAVEVTAGSR